MIAFLGVLVVLTFLGVAACSIKGLLCFSGSRSLIHDRGQDSEEENYDIEHNIQDDG